ncbi:hypothetical protein JW979_04765 [bacterium]|nr:hypothetical protein [candidate division CSSED10-310 bacterium]
MDMDRVREQTCQFLVTSEDLYWKNWIGIQDDINIVALYDKYREIFSLKTLDMIQKQMRLEQNPQLKHRLKTLYGILSLGRLEYKSSAEQQELFNIESNVFVDWKGTKIPIRSVGVKILNEPDRESRKELIDRKEDALFTHIIPLKLQWIESLFESIREMGYLNYVALCEETQDRDFYQFAAQIKRFLDDSEGLYRKYLDHYLRILSHTKLDKTTHSADLAAVMRCSMFDQFFPQTPLMEILESTINGMGFSLAKIYLDTKDRPKKKPRACVSAVNPPDDVRLTVYPMGGYEDYAGMLHETGHAIHFIHERKDLDFEFKFWGDRGFTEGTAYLFQHITTNTSWLTQNIGMDDPTEFISFNAFMNLLRFRRLSSQFLYQLDLFTGQTTQSMPEIYQYHTERAHGVVYESSGFVNFDLEFYSAGYLRARLFELQLRSFLVETYGENWWQKPGTGGFLKTLFKDGRKSRADDVVNQIGFSKLDTHYYLKTQADILNG